VLETKPDEEYVSEAAKLGPGRAKSAYERVIRPGKENPGLGQGNPGLAQPRHEENWPGGVIPARPDTPDPAQSGAGGNGQPGRWMKPAQPGRASPAGGGTLEKAGLARGASTGPAGTQRSRGEEAQPGSDRTGPAGRWDARPRPNRGDSGAGCPGGTPAQPAGRPSQGNGPRRGGRAGENPRPSRDEDAGRPSRREKLAGPAGLVNFGLPGIEVAAQPACRVYSGLIKNIPAWAWLIRPRLLLNCLFKYPAHIITHTTYISYIHKGTLVYPGLYPRQSPVYFTRTVYFTRILLLLSTRYAHSFVYSKPVRLTTSS
jgi:hypothetical protein